MQRLRGFTLIELMMVMAISGIVLALGTPSFISTIQENRLRSQTFEMANLLAYARSEAAKRPNTTVTICPAATLTSTSGCSNVNTWENGWIVLSDVNGNRSFDAATDTVLKVSPTLSNNNTLRTVGFASLNYIQFDNQGMPANSGTFVVCDTRGATSAKALVISISGQVRLAVDEDGDGIVNAHDASEVACP